MEVTNILKQMFCCHEWYRKKEDATWSEWQCINCEKTDIGELADFY